MTKYFLAALFTIIGHKTQAPIDCTFHNLSGGTEVNIQIDEGLDQDVRRSVIRALVAEAIGHGLDRRYIGLVNEAGELEGDIGPDENMTARGGFLVNGFPYRLGEYTSDHGLHFYFPNGIVRMEDPVFANVRYELCHRTHLVFDVECDDGVVAFHQNMRNLTTIYEVAAISSRITLEVIRGSGIFYDFCLTEGATQLREMLSGLFHRGTPSRLTVEQITMILQDAGIPFTV